MSVPFVFRQATKNRLTSLRYEFVRWLFAVFLHVLLSSAFEQRVEQVPATDVGGM